MAITYDNVIAMGKRAKVGDVRRGVAYLRASKDEQKLTFLAQRTQIEAWAAKEGVEIVAWHEDHLTSVTPIEERPGLGGALISLKGHRAGVLIVAKRDRIARDPILTVMVERAAAEEGAKVMSAAGEGNGDTPADAFMRAVLDAAAQYERALIRARTKAALAEKARRGERTGGDVPFGFVSVDGPMRPRKDGTLAPLKALVPHPEEQRVIAEAKRLREQGLTIRSIGTELEKVGFRSRTGGAFRPGQIHKMVAA